VRVARASCRGPLVLVDEPPEAVVPDDRSHRPGWLAAGPRRSEAEGAVRAGVVVVAGG
jgi:hypothetical protein